MRRAVLAVAWIVAGHCGIARAMATPAAPSDPIRLELSPRLCTIGSKEAQCEIRVRASWHAPHDESLCLVIVDRPDIRRCWEHYSEGTFTIDLTFSDDVRFQLKDPALREVLASETLRLIREAVRYRHKRWQPWNVFD